ncbi:hypothetical protein [Nocardioides convexus]|uniref:hypothetical protein n=1 Tax=Nocardioides convexus TaxID=2712224 RepID=UPI002418A7CE|nr:hypothetical protein [Nocardioides convexus]
MCHDLAMAAHAPHRIGVIALPGVYPYELGIASRFFGAAHVDGRPAYDVVTCSLDGGPVPTAADFSVAVTADRSVLTEVDTVIVPPWQTSAATGDPVGLAGWARRGSCPTAPGRSRSPPPGCSTGARRPPTGAPPTSSVRPSRASTSGPTSRSWTRATC